jgi:hypothetical protein
VKHLARTAVLTALTSGALVAATAPAMAAPATSAPEVAWVNTNVVVSADRSEATVLGKYRCSGGEEGTHLWVSVKQGPGIYPGHTSSGYADAWYDTNYNYTEDNPAGLTVTCDGKWHAERVTVRQVFGQLTRGAAYVQWCMFDSTGAYAGGGDDEGGLFGTVRTGA